MSLSSNAVVFSEASAAASTAAFRPHHNRAFDQLPHQHFEGTDMSFSLGTNPAFNRGEHNSNRRSDTRECSDWLADQLRPIPAKVIADEAAIGQRAAEGVKMGRNGLTMAHLVSMCRANPEFRAAFFQFCGGHLEGTPEMVAALSRAINAVVQQQPRGSK